MRPSLLRLRPPGTRPLAAAFVEDRTLDGIKAAKASAAAVELVDRLRRYHGDKSEPVLAAWTETWLKPESASWCLDPWLGSIVSPILVIHGDDDEFGSSLHPERIASGVAAPSRKIILPGIGHVPHRECPEAILEAISHFLQSLGT